jgi:fatty-acyl-CoA synthase
LVQPDGWLSTGDLAVMSDEGYVSIIGRSKETIVAAGQNIHPREVEDVIRLHPGVREVAVVGVPDRIYGETVCAWIQLHEGHSLTEQEVRRFCRDRAASYKVPRHVQFTDTFPTTASGKIQKFKLREISIQRLGLGHAGSWATP